ILEEFAHTTFGGRQSKRKYMAPPHRMHAKQTAKTGRSSPSNRRERRRAQPFSHSLRRPQIATKGAILRIYRLTQVARHRSRHKSPINCGFSALVEPEHPFYFGLFKSVGLGAL